LLGGGGGGGLGCGVVSGCVGVWGCGCVGVWVCVCVCVAVHGWGLRREKRTTNKTVCIYVYKETSALRKGGNTTT